MASTLPPGTRMPAEWAPHERTVMAWPTVTRVEQLWHDRIDPARDVHATIATAIARFEPVLMVADPADVDDACRRCGTTVDVLSAPLDDSWMRDIGPIGVLTP